MAFPYYLGQMKNNPFNDNTNDDDEFGEFTSAVTYAPTTAQTAPGLVADQPTVASALQQTPHSFPSKSIAPANGQVFFNPIPDSDDEFGDFCGPVQLPSLSKRQQEVVTNHVIAESEPRNFQPNYNIDLDSDLPSLQLTWNSGETTNSVERVEETQREAQAIEEDFGDFAAAEPVPSLLEAPTEEVQPSSSVVLMTEPIGAVPCSLPSTSIEPSDELEICVAEVVTDDEFGEFTQATSSFVLPSLDYEEVAVQEVKEESQVDPLETNEPVNLFALDDDEAELNNFVSTNDITVDPSLLDPIGPLEDPLDAHVTVQEPEEMAEDEEFGDFTAFQSSELPPAPPENQPEAEEDEFDDFEVAMPTETETPAVVPETPTTPEGRIQQLLTVVFPFPESKSTGSESIASLLSLCGAAKGALWSYVRELDSSPALSFQWRHSGAHQRFLASLRIDSQHSTNSINLGRWSSTMSPPTLTNHSMPVNSIAPTNDSGLLTKETSLPVAPLGATSAPAVAPVSALDLDFFLNQSTSSTSVSSNSISLLETIEKELMTVDSPVKMKKPTPPEPSANVVFDQFASLAIHSSTGNGSAIDLLK